MKCRHCLIKNRHGDFPLRDLKELFKNISRRHIFKKVVFTGGEPFLVFENLKKAINCAKENGLKTGVVTSGYWAKTKNITREYLMTLKGLDLIAVSMDKYHQEYVSMKNIENILAVAKELGIRTGLIAVAPREEQIDYLVGKYLSDCEIHGLSLKPLRNWRGLTADVGHDVMGMKGSFCSIQPPYVDINGDVFYCCGTAGLIKKKSNLLYLGNVHKGAVDSDFNFKKRRKIAAFLGHKKSLFFKKIGEAGIKLSGKYYCKCDICYDIFKYNSENKYLIGQIGI